MQDEAGRRRRVRAASVVAFLILVAGCSGTGQEADPHHDSDASGISRHEYCSSGRPALEHVAATRTDSEVRLTWQQPFVASAPVTFRVYRRPEAEAHWTRIAEVTLDPDAARRFVDASASDGSQQYAVTEVGECGEGPRCSLTGTGRRCATATVPARGAG